MKIMKIKKTNMINKFKTIISVILICSCVAGVFAEDSDSEDSSAREAESKAAKVEKAKDAAARRLAKLERTDEYLGIKYYKQNNMELEKGDVGVLLRGTSGSFNIYAGNDLTGKKSILATVDDGSSSCFEVLIDKTKYTLGHSASTEKVIRKVGENGQVAYIIKGLAQVVIDFGLMTSGENRDEDIIKVTVYTTNISGKDHRFAVRGIFDTVLGENLNDHFILESGAAVRSERQLTESELKEERFFLSTDNKTSAQFLLSGADITEPSLVTFANRTVLEKSLFEPVSVEKRGFNSSVSYRNSSVALNWRQKKLAAKETDVIVFYIAVGTEGYYPRGLSLIDGTDIEDKPVLDTGKKERPENSGYDESEDVRPAEKTAVRKPVQRPVQKKNIEVSSEREPLKTDVEFIVPPIKDYQLDQRYIQNLIDRINALQSNPDLDDRSEVSRLNAELDAILEKIRQQQ